MLPLADPPSPLLGALAGLSTSILWTFTALFFAAAVKRLGVTRTNASRLFIALALHFITFRLAAGAWWPQTSTAQLAYLAASGIIGFSICDQALLVAFRDIGPRLSLLIMTTSPLFALAIAWIVLAERPSPWALIGIALTLAGVAWVVLERPAEERLAEGAPDPGMEAPLDTEARPAARDSARFRCGLLLAFVGAASQAGGFFLSRLGMSGGIDSPTDAASQLPPQAATFIRLLFGTLGVLPMLIGHEWHRRRAASRAEADALGPGAKATGYACSACGAVTGPYFGVWLSLVAISAVPLGVAQTLCSLQPVLILPFTAWLLKERVSPRAVIGAAVAVAGSAMLFLG